MPGAGPHSHLLGHRILDYQDFNFIEVRFAAPIAVKPLTFTILLFGKTDVFEGTSSDWMLSGVSFPFILVLSRGNKKCIGI
jgi:hypothetical protein